MRWLRASGLVLVGALQAGLVAAAEPPAEPVGKLDGAVIEAGTAIEVPAAAVKRLALDNGARVTLRAGTSAIASPQQWYPPEKGGKSVRGSRVFLKEGEVSVRLPTDAAKPTAVSIATAGGAAVLLWHGAARVSASDGTMTVVVDEGAAYVGAQDQWLRLNAGSAAVMPKKQPPKLFKGRPAAPELVPCADGGVGLGFGADKIPVRVCWSAVAGATTGYHVELANDPAMEEVVEALDVPSTATTIEPRLAAGTYWARVRAVGGEGVPGLDSTARSVRVLRATLPPGAVVASDGVVLLSREAVVTVEPSGALVTSAGGYDVTSALASAMSATPAPTTAKAYGLGGQRARVIRFRDERGEARLALALREIRARVDMMPARARWPQTPIDAVVVLEDTSRRVDLTAEPVSLEVAVDARPVPVTWTRTGHTFRTRIAPIDGPGPFFVRVVVRDQGGAEIGSRVIDIDGRRALRDVEQKLRERREAEERR